MRSLPGRVLALAIALAALSTSARTRAAQPPAPQREADLRRECHEAMLRATRFMVDRVSTRGGYLWRYLPDLSRRWGEMEAYDSQIAVQPPGTPTLGQVFLDAYRATGDEAFYDAAAKAARALVAGQLEPGGWHYFIDFGGEPSLRRWYATIGRNGWRLEEHQSYRGNATFDDDVTAAATRLLLRIYLEKRDPAFEAPLDKALAFILESQLPNGGWPQRYPPQADYTSLLTFNDAVIWRNVQLLVDAHLTLGDARFLEPIRRGMDVYLLAQQPAPQAGWTEQYTSDLEPAAARTYEPRALSPPHSAEHIRLLLRFYRLTGERKYLARIPEALDWLERCRLPKGLTEGGRFSHPTLVEVGTDRPLFIHREGSNVVNGRYFVDHDPRAPITHTAGGGRALIDVASLRSAYEKVSALPPEEAKRNSPLAVGRSPSRASWNPGGWLDERASGAVRSDDAEVRQVLAALDGQGRWLSRHEMTSHPYVGAGQPGPATDAFATTFVGDETDTSPFYDPSDQQYISTLVFARNMRLLARALETAPGSGSLR